LATKRKEKKKKKYIYIKLVPTLIIVFGVTPDDGSNAKTCKVIVLDNFTTYNLR
jgi:hypothetical protein